MAAKNSTLVETLVDSHLLATVSRVGVPLAWRPHPEPKYCLAISRPGHFERLGSQQVDAKLY